MRFRTATPIDTGTEPITVPYRVWWLCQLVAFDHRTTSPAPRQLPVERTVRAELGRRRSVGRAPRHLDMPFSLPKGGQILGIFFPPHSTYRDHADMGT